MPIKQHAVFTNFHEVQHPLLQHKLSLLRDRNTDKKEFNELIGEISTLLVYEVTKDLPLINKVIDTPLESCEMPVLAGKKPVILAVLRAGIGMVDGFLNLMPSARVAHIGLYRDETTLEPHLYYFKIPSHSKDRQFYICDPMLATGGSAIRAIDKLKSSGVRKISFVCILAAPEGVERVFHAHPDVPLFAAKLDRKLNKKGYILPGLGDAGDRMFGTK
ncbi:MAG TPA: uracil phosphoribosyltransferase [Coxiellaceae bacterium]|nr:MAG: uracil phosphoribosyltransferase [Gammaproteobacteria bacterium RBG_16_37_9]HBC71241.1 uracil phosphoribosyltransferase [Coxiellaceae bacterium]HBS52169.1 uracil phosphoribosyltransferase [Coxiellaceae bacterium]HBY55620.1 uracil phosphoribosyltransferase [Coxiellaceae bacterium]